jgi:dihydrofolate synthase/folylpolyglutamate synthase
MKKNYEQTLDFLFSQLPMFQRVGPKAFKKDLTNIIKLTEALDNPQHKFPSIHIAGTNGKGSTAFTLSAIFQAQGFKTGLYVSPHYKDFRERIRIGSTYVPKKFVIGFVEKQEALFKEIKPSFFEISVAMAFAYFAEQKVDIAIIETGLGGRLDSTNLVNPLLSIITNISYDHQNFLGDTLPEIAGEKAGIIKNATPVVIGETHSETKPVFEKVAKQKKAPITFADKPFVLKEKNNTLEHTTYDVWKENHLYLEALKVNLSGSFQSKNLKTVFESLAVLQKNHPEYTITEKALRQGLLHIKELTRYIGRWQVLSRNPIILCDSAHNEGGLKITTKQLMEIPHSNLHCVLGFVNDKNVDMPLSFFPKEARYYFAKANIPRGLDAKLLKAAAAGHHLEGKAYSSVKNALKAAKRAAQADDLIFVGGSVFTVAEVV